MQQCGWGLNGHRDPGGAAIDLGKEEEKEEKETDNKKDEDGEDHDEEEDGGNANEEVYGRCRGGYDTVNPRQCRNWQRIPTNYPIAQPLQFA